LADTTFTFGSCSKLLSHNGEACYQKPTRPVNGGVGSDPAEYLFSPFDGGRGEYRM